MFDVITFGSAIQDTFLKLDKKNYQILTSKLPEKESVCFALGSKIFINGLKVSTGGGGTNAACTFSKQGFKTAFCGKIGDDQRGEAVIEALKKFNIDISFVKKDKERPTAYSVILSLPKRERTILIFQGACYFLHKEDTVVPDRVRWFFLAPLSGESVEVFEHIVMFAKKHKIKVAVNPGNTQLKLAPEILKPIFKEIDILILNREEASILTKMPLSEERKMVKKLNSFTKGIIVLTMGKKGCLVFDGKYIFQASAHNVLPIDKTGAGDAFGSGFVSGLLQKNDIEYAIQLATANATNCIGEIGAKNGLLERGDWGKWPKIKVIKKLW